MRLNVKQLVHTLSKLNIVPDREGQALYVAVSESLPTVRPVGDEGREYRESKALHRLQLTSVLYRQGGHIWFEWEIDL